MDNGVDFKIYLAEQLKNIKREIENSLKLEEVKSDGEMVKNTKQALSLVENFDVSSVDKKELVKVLKLQKLVEEYKQDAD